MPQTAPRLLLPRRPTLFVDTVDLLTSAVYFERLCQAIAAAKTRLLLEFYIFRSDETGHAIADLLVSAKERGVRVCLIYDSFGSLGDSEAVIDYLIAHGVEVIEFHPLFFRRRRWLTRTWFRRDHRKIVVVDGELALLGSGNVGDEYQCRSPTDFYDVAVAITGNIVVDIEKEFWRVWKKHGGGAPLQLSRPRSNGPGRRGLAQVLANREYTARHVIESAYVHAIRQAQESVYIANAYFVPNLRIRRALVMAVRRGVDVRLLAPGQSNHHLVHLAGAYVFGRLLKHGVRIFAWRPAILHAKYGVIDGRWAIIGSYNFDAFSLQRNLEIALAFEHAEVARDFRRLFLSDLKQAEELSFQEWQRLPWPRRLLQWMAHKLRNWL